MAWDGNRRVEANTGEYQGGRLESGWGGCQLQGNLKCPMGGKAYLLGQENHAGSLKGDRGRKNKGDHVMVCSSRNDFLTRLNAFIPKRK